MAAAKLGKFSIGHATVNPTCSTLVSTVHISFLRAPISQGTKEYTRRPFREITARWQGPDRQNTQKFHEEKCSHWSIQRLRADREPSYCLSPGDIWSRAKTECQPRRVQGQRHFQVRWMHAALAELQAPSSRAVTAHFHGTRTGRAAFPGGKAARDTSQPSRGLAAVSSALWATLLLFVLQNRPGSQRDYVALQLKCTGKLELVQQWQCFLRRTAQVFGPNGTV